MPTKTVPRGTKAKPTPPPPPPPAGIAKVSHTMPADVAERLRTIAFFQRVSESAIIEVALAHLWDEYGSNEAIGAAVRDAGHGMRRR